MRQETPADDNEVRILECRASVKRIAGTRLGIALGLKHVKNTVFFPRVDIANHLLTRHSPLAPLDQVDE